MVFSCISIIISKEFQFSKFPGRSNKSKSSAQMSGNVTGCHMLPIFCSGFKRQKGSLYTSNISDQVLDMNGKTIKWTRCGSTVPGGLLGDFGGSAARPTTEQRRRTGFLVVIFLCSPRSVDVNVSWSGGIKSKKPHIIWLTTSSPSAR